MDRWEREESGLKPCFGGLEIEPSVVRTATRCRRCQRATQPVSDGHSGQTSPIEAKTSSRTLTAAVGDIPNGGSSQAERNALAQSMEIPYSFAHPCSSHS